MPWTFQEWTHMMVGDGTNAVWMWVLVPRMDAHDVWIIANAVLTSKAAGLWGLVPRVDTHNGCPWGLVPRMDTHDVWRWNYQLKMALSHSLYPVLDSKYLGFHEAPENIRATTP